MHVKLRTEARLDIVQASLFYEKQRVGLGEYFTDCIFADLDRLEAEGGLHEVVGRVHRKLSKKFPYGIYYRTPGEVIEVVAILDCRRNPSYIQDTIAERTEDDQGRPD